MNKSNKLKNGKPQQVRNIRLAYRHEIQNVHTKSGFANSPGKIEGFARGDFTEALRRASRRVSELESKKNGTSD
jgi:hypothetical protein